MSRDGGNGNPASTAQLRLGSGFHDDERDEVVARVSKLDRRLQRFDADATQLELSVKGRDSNEQHVVFEARLPGHDRLVATSSEPRLRDALNDVRDDMWRLIDDAVTKRDDARKRPT